jgi:hypothetical protein
MSTPEIHAGSASATGAEADQNVSPPAQPLVLDNFLPPDRILAQLSVVRQTQPVAALAAVNQYREQLTEPFLHAVERGVSDPLGNFAKDGMLFNYAAYFLAKWREAKAYPLFIRWFRLPGEEALELGGDTVIEHGGRFLAAVCGGDVEPIKALIADEMAHDACRTQGLAALAILSAWNEWPRPELESYFLSLAREGLVRKPGPLWSSLAGLSVSTELLQVFPELRRALDEGLIPAAFLPAEELKRVEEMPRGTLAGFFASAHPPITDVLEETRWWAGFQRGGQAAAPSTVTAQEKVGRNDACPCGSGKKFKKCCGA